MVDVRMSSLTVLTTVAPSSEPENELQRQPERQPRTDFSSSFQALLQAAVVGDMDGIRDNLDASGHTSKSSFSIVRRKNDLDSLRKRSGLSRMERAEFNKLVALLRAPQTLAAGRNPRSVADGTAKSRKGKHRVADGTAK